MLRDVISHLARWILGGDPSLRAEGHGGRLCWQPHTLSPQLISIAAQVEDTFVESATMGLLLLHHQSFPLGMVMLPLLVYLAGSSHTFT